MLQVEELHRPGLGPISFQIDDGECLALTGPSGAGRSLLLRALADLDPNQGRVTVDGRGREDMPATEWRCLVTYLPAESGWWRDRVGDHMADPSAARALLGRLGFADPDAIMDSPVARLSSGERQRAALVRALLRAARVLLLDEPTSALDVDSCARVEEVLGERLAKGTAVLLVSHDPEQIARMSARGLRLEKGRLVP